MNLIAIFITGLTTGGLSCLAMQGGLLASVIANQKGNDTKTSRLDLMPVGLFLGSKLIAHMILGFLLGALGSAITLSLNMRVGFQVFTALFMFATAMNLIDAHPIFRYVVIQPPKFIGRLIKNEAKGRACFTPVVLGIFTVLVPCGVTQAMEVLAINTGSPAQGALIMGAFVMGTLPLFTILGMATVKLSEGWYQTFTQFASIILILMSLYFINGALIALNSPFAVTDLPNLSSKREEVFPINLNENGEQEVLIKATSVGYEPTYVQVKKGTPVKLTVESKETYTCALYFILKEFGIEAFLKATDSQTFTFTPKRTGRFVYTCSMGMYTGIMEVI